MSPLPSRERSVRKHRVRGCAHPPAPPSEIHYHRCWLLTLPRACARGPLPLPQGERERQFPCSASLRLDRRAHSHVLLGTGVAARAVPCPCMLRWAAPRVDPPVKPEGYGEGGQSLCHLSPCGRGRCAAPGEGEGPSPCTTVRDPSPPLPAPSPSHGLAPAGPSLSRKGRGNEAGSKACAHENAFTASWVFMKSRNFDHLPSFMVITCTKSDLMSRPVDFAVR